MSKYKTLKNCEKDCKNCIYFKTSICPVTSIYNYAWQCLRYVKVEKEKANEASTIEN